LTIFDSIKSTFIDELTVFETGILESDIASFLDIPIFANRSSMPFGP
jgi:hypothetical protein